MLLREGELDGVRVLSEGAVRAMTTPVAVTPRERRTPGWDAPNWPGPNSWSPRAYGHYGFTGTSYWLDPERGIFFVLLTSRLHGKQRRSITDVSRVLELAALDVVDRTR
jgi:CubicO group peptidase (beta-lactamase class C family)